eukprot:7954428-Karenia_brevis.AAC.1
MRRESLHLDVISFSAAISACEKGGQWQWARTEMRRESLHVDVISFSAAISACEKEGRTVAACVARDAQGEPASR